MPKKLKATETTEAVQAPPEGILDPVKITRSAVWQPTMALMFNNFNELQQLWQDVNNLENYEWRKIPTTYMEAQKTYGIKLP